MDATSEYPGRCRDYYSRAGGRSQLHRAALAITREGKPVFPCNHAPDKSPLTGKGGFHKATTDSRKVNAYWNKYLGASIGVPTGDVSRLLVLDVDVDQSKGLDGEADLGAF